jgi:hypothetical protein
LWFFAARSFCPTIYDPPLGSVCASSLWGPGSGGWTEALPAGLPTAWSHCRLCHQAWDVLYKPTGYSAATAHSYITVSNVRGKYAILMGKWWNLQTPIQRSVLFWWTKNGQPCLDNRTHRCTVRADASALRVLGKLVRLVLFLQNQPLPPPAMISDTWLVYLKFVGM